ncbi:MAG: M1 family metallopeptidase [candidate division Zixibacteria bacterium]|nr:M1 family metallopeptidase [candidate division Zixibacteria bacterium]
MTHPTIVSLIFIILSSLFIGNAGAFDIDTFISNFEDKNDQTALVGQIDSLTIIRGNAEFHLGKGELTLFDFGCSKPMAISFSGTGRFAYTPPDNIELHQLKKFTGEAKLDAEFESIAFYYSVELDDFSDFSIFHPAEITKMAWDNIQDCKNDALDHLNFSVPNKLLSDMLTEGPGTFFMADFRIDKFERLMFVEDPSNDDWYTLSKLTRKHNSKEYDTYSAYSPDRDLASTRGMAVIDIKHYEIGSTIDRGGNMIANCRIHFVPMKWGSRFVYFDWYHKNRAISASDSRGDSLKIVSINDEPGLGIVFDGALPLGEQQYIDIEYECNSLKNIWGVYYISGLTSWYPKNPFWDRTTFKLTFDCQKDYEVISCGELTETQIEGERSITKWAGMIPVEYFSFNIGIFNSQKSDRLYLPSTNVYMAKNIPHNDIQEFYAKYFGELSSGDMLSQVTSDVSSALTFFQNLFEYYPFESIKVVEIPASFGQGSPGLIHLSWGTFQFADRVIGQAQFKAHEISHQWWGHVVDHDSYRDVWITEGLAEYSGFLYFQSVALETDSWKDIVSDWQEDIINGAGDAEGTIAGPVVLGRRLNSSLSDDYSLITYSKGAYIFHMMRYLLYDYTNNSDAAFKAFLNDLLIQYNDRPITSIGLQKLLEDHLKSDMSWFFNQWVYGTGIPTYHFSYDHRKTDDDKFMVTCHVRQENVPDNFMMLVPITVLFGGDQYVHLKLWIDKAENEIQLPLLPLKPKRIDFNTYDAVLCRVKDK